LRSRVSSGIPAADFLFLPERASKPRLTGVTHVLDKGLPLATLKSLLELASNHIDFVKFGWGTAYVSRHIRSKVVACRDHGVRVCTGGTLLEIAAAQGKVTAFARWARSLGIDTVEVSEGTVGLSRTAKSRLIEELSGEFTVLSEVGSKDPSQTVEPTEWAERMQSDLAAGAAYVIAEGRESGTVGLYGPQQDVRAELVEAILARVPPAQVIFEAPARTQQTWFITRVGVDVNLGNIAPDDVLGLETLRRGLRADTAVLTVAHALPAGGQRVAAVT
jgi:phosphosulfolactate synthase